MTIVISACEKGNGHPSVSKCPSLRRQDYCGYVLGDHAVFRCQGGGLVRAEEAREASSRAQPSGAPLSRPRSPEVPPHCTRAAFPGKPRDCLPSAHRGGRRSRAPACPLSPVRGPDGQTPTSLASSRLRDLPRPFTSLPDDGAPRPDRWVRAGSNAFPGGLPRTCWSWRGC